MDRPVDWLRAAGARELLLLLLVLLDVVVVVVVFPKLFRW